MQRLLKDHWLLISIIALFVIIRVATLEYHAVASWDASVYVGMGKYLFSHGAVGTWEALRPLGLPIIVGLGWKLGLNPYTVGIVFALVVSAAMLVLVYFFAEEMAKGAITPGLAGNCAVILLATAGLFFNYSAVPVTDIVSIFFALLSLFLIYRSATTKQYFISGLVVAVAFNFRFPQGLLLVVGGLLIILKLLPAFANRYGAAKLAKRIKWAERIGDMFEHLVAFAGGFFAIVVPCLIINYHMYGNAFLPYIEATAGIRGYPSLYDKGFYFYFQQVFLQDPLFLLAFLPIGLLWQKKYRSVATISVTLAAAIVMGYFLYQIHDEARYALAFLPYIALLAGVGLAYLLERYELSPLLFFGILTIAVFMVHAGALVYDTDNQNIPAFYNFNTYLNDVPGARVLSSTPYMLAYSDVLLTHNLYGDWDAAYSDYNTFRSSNDYISLDSCNLDLDCADKSDCQADKQELLTELNKQDSLVFSQTTPASQCQLMIYKIKH